MSLRSLVFSTQAILFALGVSLAGPQQPKQPPKKTEEAKKPAEKRVVPELSGFEVQDPRKMRAEKTQLAATRGGLQPEALAPQRAKFYGASALFAWKYEGKTTRFVVVFRNENEDEVFRDEANSKEYSLPPKAFHFQPGDVYSWSVATTPPMIGPGPSEPAEFVVVSDAERTEIEKDLSAIPAGDEYEAGLARARSFTDHRLWFDALGAYSGLIAKFPNRGEAYERRATIYHQLKATQPLAEADFSRADELQVANSKN